MIPTYILFVVFISYCIAYCSKGKQTSIKQTEQAAAQQPVAVAPVLKPVSPDKPAAVGSVVLNNSEKTQMKKKKTANEADDDDGDPFADLVKKLGAKQAPQQNTESLLAEDEENPLANFVIPERPNPKKLGASSRKDNIVAMPMIKTIRIASAMTQETEDVMEKDKEGRMVSTKKPKVTVKPSTDVVGGLGMDATQNSEMSKEKHDVKKTQSVTAEAFAPPVLKLKSPEPIVKPTRVKRVAKRMGGATTESQASEAKDRSPAN